ncbi:hypothetical protein DH26_gp130 [Chloriridovirus anopheles1]|uniref:Uncharacterized protein n=1 Tax=Chloriridovirus anopheles1 TaxID=1465751 RepID=W8QN45_9VIRU|nr:hypothetical protein DH26_gp130 [Anopheles minimus iridovirus]AHL67618.1 hypothetical protein AMIV_130 [Anopheles minimus iridovirus]
MNDSALQRIAYKAGITRISESVYGFVREAGNMYLRSITEYAEIYAEYEGKKTISGDHAIHAIENTGFADQYKIKDSLKPCKISGKVKVLAKIREYQKQHDCNTLAKAPIERDIKSFTHFKISKEGVQNIHSALEYFIYKLFFSALLITLNAKRKTVSVDDVKLTLRMINDNCKSINFR